MAYHAGSIANYFIQKAKEDGVDDMTPMKVLKLVYFACGWFAALENRPLIDEEIEAWQFGPVAPSVYHEFKDFGNRPVTRLASYYESYTEEFDAYDIPDEPEVIEVLEGVWEVYGDLSGIQLSNLSHDAQGAWAKTIEENNGRITSHLRIPFEAIQAYFMKVDRGEA